MTADEARGVIMATVMRSLPQPNSAGFSESLFSMTIALAQVSGIVMANASNETFEAFQELVVVSRNAATMGAAMLDAHALRKDGRLN